MRRDENDSRFDELYKRYFNSIAKFLRGLGFSRDRAQDLAQDTFLRVYRSMANYRGESEWSFLKTTARNVALNAVRGRETIKRKATETSLDALPQAADAISHSPWTGSPLVSPEEALIVDQEWTRRRVGLEAAIRSLPEGHRKCLLLRLSGCTYQEIETEMGLTSDAVKSRLYDTRKRLKELLCEDPAGFDRPGEQS